MKKLLFAVAILASFLSSCGDDEITVDPVVSGTAYLPLAVGDYHIYNVVETSYAANVPTVSKFQTRETVDKIVKDQTGKDWFRVAIDQRESSTDAWRVEGVKMIEKTTTVVKVQQNNRITVDMVFPIEEGKTWNPNAFNEDYDIDEEEQNQNRYAYKGIAKAFESGGKTYENTLTIVKEAGDPSVFNYKEIYDVLAVNLGTIQRVNLQRYYCDAGAGTNCEVGSGYIISGKDRIETLESSGKNVQ